MNYKKWLTKIIKKDTEAIKNNQFLYNEYCQLDDKINNMSFNKSYNIILNSYIEEYKIINKYDKTIEYYNDLLGWYKRLIKYINN